MAKDRDKEYCGSVVLVESHGPATCILPEGTMRAGNSRSNSSPSLESSPRRLR